MWHRCNANNQSYGQLSQSRVPCPLHLRHRGVPVLSSSGQSHLLLLAVCPTRLKNLSHCFPCQTLPHFPSTIYLQLTQWWLSQHDQNLWYTPLLYWPDWAPCVSGLAGLWGCKEGESRAALWSSAPSTAWQAVPFVNWVFIHRKLVVENKVLCAKTSLTKHSRHWEVCLWKENWEFQFLNYF